MKRLMFITVMCAFVSAPAFADLSGIGDPVEGNSWAQSFNETGVGNFDLVAVRMVSAGDTFESPTHRGLASGWSVVYENDGVSPTLATAAGPAQTNMTWNIWFAGPQNGNPFDFDFVAFRGDTLLESAHVSWNGSAWSVPNGINFPAGTWQPTRAEVVPLPGAILLGLLGLSAAGIKLRKFA